MSSITVDGGTYKVVESLGFQHSAGVYAKAVSTPQGERIAVRERRGGPWRWWMAEDRLQPRGSVKGMLSAARDAGYEAGEHHAKVEMNCA